MGQAGSNYREYPPRSNCSEPSSKAPFIFDGMLLQEDGTRKLQDASGAHRNRPTGELPEPEGGQRRHQGPIIPKFARRASPEEVELGNLGKGHAGVFGPRRHNLLAITGLAHVPCSPRASPTRGLVRAEAHQLPPKRHAVQGAHLDGLGDAPLEGLAARLLAPPYVEGEREAGVLESQGDVADQGLADGPAFGALSRAQWQLDDGVVFHQPLFGHGAHDRALGVGALVEHDHGLVVAPGSMPLDREERLILVLADLVHGREPLLVVDVEGEREALIRRRSRGRACLVFGQSGLEGLLIEILRDNRAMLLRSCHGDACNGVQVQV